jgi:eukaryotic-like serine/threonine-protein kinase
MTDNPRLRELLDELHDSHATPEEVCRSCPELLPEVRARWRAVCRVRAELDALFPPPSEGDASTPELQEGRTGFSSTQLAGMRRSPSVSPQDGATLPQVPGYKVEAVLGHGGMGIVFRAKHLRLNRLVALKMVLAGASARSRERARFQREAEAVAGLRHPNVVQIYDVGDVDGRPYFTMELVEGGSLAEKLTGTPQPAGQAAQLCATLALAVQAAHTSGIIHRDLKPSNVLLTAEGTPKITDFGLARRLDDGAGLTQTGLAVGTPSYMAPEQAGGRSDAIGPAVDVYALGAILYELLTGRPPFKGETAAETVHQVIYQEPVAPTLLNPKVPRDLETICLKCLQKEPERRYGSAAALAEDLSRFLRGEPILARRAGPVERVLKWTKRHRALAASLVSGILLLNGLVAVFVSVLVNRSVLTRLVEADFHDAVDAEQRQEWEDARIALERAKGRLGDGGPEDLRRRASQMDRELTVVGKLREIRDSHMEPEGEAARISRTIAAYESAFQEAGVWDGPTDAAVVASRIRSTGIAPVLLAALDDWARRDDHRRDWLFEIARQVEPNPTNRGIRDPKLWNDRDALEQFARSAPIEDQPVPFLLSIAWKIGLQTRNGLAFLKRVQQLHPKDFEANYFLAQQLVETGNSADGARYYQAAIAIRPNVAIAHLNLGTALGNLGRIEEGLEEKQIAMRLSPESGFYRNYVNESLFLVRRFDEAVQEARRACELEPHNAVFLSNLGLCLAAKKKYDEAVDTLRQAIALDPKCWDAHRELRDIAFELHHPEKAQIAWREWLAQGPPDLDSWDGYAEFNLYLGDEAEYRRARKELLQRFGSSADPQAAERVGRACLFLPASEDELRQATNLIDRALASERAKPGWLLPYFRFAKALAEYRAGRYENARSLLSEDTFKILVPGPRLLLAMVQHRLGQTDAARKTFEMAIAAFDWDPAKATNREAWMYHLLRREAETVLASEP